MCGMSFRQASHIGTEEFWSDPNDQNKSGMTSPFFIQKKII